MAKRMMVNSDSMPTRLSMKMPQPFLNDRHVIRSRVSANRTLPRPISTQAPRRIVGRPVLEYSLVANPGIQVDVENINDDVGQQGEESDEQHRAHHQRQVFASYRLE